MTPQQLQRYEVKVRLRGMSDAHPGVVVRISSHAASRYHERVRPSLDADSAARECARWIANAELDTEPPSWLGPTSQRPAYYLCMGDFALPADPDPFSSDRLVVRTVLARGAQSSSRRFARQQRRSSKAADRRTSRELQAKRNRKRRQRSSRRAIRRSTTNRTAVRRRSRTRHPEGTL